MGGSEGSYFSKGICSKVNIIAWLKFELMYSDSAVQGFNHYTVGTAPSLPGALRPRVVAPESFLSKGQIELNYVLITNWIVLNGTVLILKLHTYAKLNCLK